MKLAKYMEVSKNYVELEIYSTKIEGPQSLGRGWGGEGVNE